MRHRNGTEEVFYIGATGHPPSTTPPAMNGGRDQTSLAKRTASKGCFGADDAPAAELPNGHIIFTADAGPIRGTFSQPTRFFVYDPESNIISQMLTTP